MHNEIPPSLKFSLPVTDRWSAEIVAPVLSAWRSSGLSFVGFCRAHGIDAQRLQYWLVRERELESRAEGSATSAFTEIRPLATTVAAHAGGVQIILPRGIMVLAGSGDDLGQVRAVVEALL